MPSLHLLENLIGYNAHHSNNGAHMQTSLLISTKVDVNYPKDMTRPELILQRSTFALHLELNLILSRTSFVLAPASV